MNATETYKLTCSMLKAYDLHTGNGGAESVIRDPHQWLTVSAPWLSIYADAARILIDCMESMEKKTTPASTLAAVNRIIKSAPEHLSALQGIFTRPDVPGYHLCNGNLIITMTEDIKAARHVPDDVQQRGIDVKPFLDEIGAASGEKIQLPTVTQLKAFMQAEKARGHKKAERPVCIGDFWFCNPQFLADILTIIPDAEAIKPESDKRPLYFHGKKACAMLLPIRPRDDIRERPELRAELKAA